MDKKLELGCGENPQSSEHIGIDILDYGQEIIRDITRGIPFNDDTFIEVYACHVLEHINKKDVRFVWEEIYRVLKPGGILIARMPHATDAHAVLPEHLSQWNEQVVSVLCNQYGSKDHHTKTNYVVLYLEHIKDELRFVVAKSSAPNPSNWDLSKVEW